MLFTNVNPFPFYPVPQSSTLCYKTQGGYLVIGLDTELGFFLDKEGNYLRRATGIECTLKIKNNDSIYIHIDNYLYATFDVYANLYDNSGDSARHEPIAEVSTVLNGIVWDGYIYQKNKDSFLLIWITIDGESTWKMCLYSIHEWKSRYLEHATSIEGFGIPSEDVTLINQQLITE